MFAYRALAFLAAPAEDGTMKKHNAHPNKIYPGRNVYVLPMPDSRKPRTVSLGFWGRLLWLFGVKLAYTVRPAKFDRFGRCTHESRLVEITTKHSTLMYSFWE